VAESVGLEGRANYYDRSGAVRDMVQNHLLQLLCLTAMEPPNALDASSVRTEKIKVLKALSRFTPDNVDQNSVRAQYKAGLIDGEPMVRRPVLFAHRQAHGNPALRDHSTIQTHAAQTV